MKKKNKIITRVLINKFDYKDNKINLLLLKKINKLNKNLNYLESINILKNNGFIEKNNINFINYIYNKINYPNILLNDIKKKKLINFKKYINILNKQDIFLKKKYRKSRIFIKLNPSTERLSYLHSKHSRRGTFHDRLFDNSFKYVNAIQKKKKERRRGNYLARLLNRKTKILFFQGRPKIRYFKFIGKIHKQDLLLLKKNYPINFKKFTYEKKRYKKNIISEIWRKIIYKGNFYKKRVRYNLSEKKNIKSTIRIHKKRTSFFLSTYKRKYFPRFKVKGKAYATSPRFSLKRKYFVYSKLNYRKYWEKGCKHKIILDKEKFIDSEYYYLDPGLILIKLKLKNISLNYESFDYISSIIQDKGFSLLFYIFLYCPLVLCIHLIRKEYYKIK